jgi:transcriptional regulator with XRE-family HTH domain
LEHIGHHILKRRLDLKLQQKEVARQLGTNPWSLRDWQRGRHEIGVRFYPAIMAFLGYNPLPSPRTPAERIAYARMSRGWSRKKLAKISGVDEATVRRMEKAAERLEGRPLLSVCRALGLILG